MAKGDTSIGSMMAPGGTGFGVGGLVGRLASGKNNPGVGSLLGQRTQQRQGSLLRNPRMMQPSDAINYNLGPSPEMLAQWFGNQNNNTDIGMGQRYRPMF